MDRLEPVDRDMIARLDAAAMLRSTIAWSSVNSGTGNLLGLRQVAGMLADAIASLPGDVKLVDPSPVERVGGDGTVSMVEHGRHLHLVVRPSAPVQMLLTGHMDTVYPADHAFQTVNAVENGRVIGPGVADMKGGLAVMIAALAALEGSSDAGNLGYEVVVNSDEETGSLSSAALLAHAAAGKTAALTFEPALADGTLAGARGGTGNFSLVFRGVSAHAGRNPEDGRNAIVAAADAALRLADAIGPDLSVNPARIEGGGPNNVVPDLAVLMVNFRPVDQQAIVRAQALLDATVRDVASRHGVRVELHGSFNRPPKPIDAGAARLFALVRDVGADLDLPIDWRATGGVCDGNNIAAAGVPVIDTMGVRGGAIHSADEYMIVDSLAERAALAAVTMRRIGAGALA